MTQTQGLAPLHLHSASRPQIAGRPALLGIQAVVPRLTLDPRLDGTLLVEVLVMVESNSASWHSLLLVPGELEPLLQAWLADPEGILRERFGWTPPAEGGAAAPARSAQTLTLADLGL